MTLLWLLTGSVLANVAIWSGQKMAPSVGMAFVTIGLSLGWMVPHAPLVALRNGTNYHTVECLVVRDAVKDGEALMPLRSESDARKLGLTAHRCVDHRRSPSATYTVMTPHKYPAAKVRK